MKPVYSHIAFFIAGFLAAYFYFKTPDNSDQIDRIKAEKQAIQDSLKISRSKQSKLQDSIQASKQELIALRQLNQAQNEVIKAKKKEQAKTEAKLAEILKKTDEEMDSLYQARFPKVVFKVKPAVFQVQREVYQDLVRFDSLKSYTGLLEFHIDSLNLEIKNLYQLVEIQDRQIREKDKEIGLRLQSEVLDQEIISIYKKDADKYRKQNRLLKILVISLPVGVLLLK